MEKSKKNGLLFTKVVKIKNLRGNSSKSGPPPSDCTCVPNFIIFKLWDVRLTAVSCSTKLHVGTLEGQSVQNGFLSFSDLGARNEVKLKVPFEINLQKSQN